MNAYFEQLQALCDSDLDSNSLKLASKFIRDADASLTCAQSNAFSAIGAVYYSQTFLNLVNLRYVVRNGQSVDVTSVGSAIYYLQREPEANAAFDSLNTLLNHVYIPDPRDIDDQQETAIELFGIPEGSISLVYTCLHIYCMLLFYDLVANIKRVSVAELILGSIDKPADIILSVTVDRFMESVYLYENSCIILEDGYAEYNRYARTLTDNILRSIESALAGMLILDDGLSESTLTYGELFHYCIDNHILPAEQLKILELLVRCDDTLNTVLLPTNKEAINNLFKSIAEKTVQMYNGYTVTDEHKQMITQMGETLTNLFGD